MTRLPITAEGARAIVAASLDPDDAREVGAAVRVLDYFAVELHVEGLVAIGGAVPTVTVATGELVWRPELEVGTGWSEPD